MRTSEVRLPKTSKEKFIVRKPEMKLKNIPSIKIDEKNFYEVMNRAKASGVTYSEFVRQAIEYALENM